MSLKSLNVTYGQVNLSMQTMLGIEKILEHLYMFTVIPSNLSAWNSVKYGLKPIMSYAAMTWNNCSPRTKSHEALNTEVSRRANNRHVMSSENTLLRPCGRHFLQEQKKLEAYFPQSRNMLPTLHCNFSNLDMLLTVTVTFPAGRRLNLVQRSYANAVHGLPKCGTLAKMFKINSRGIKKFTIWTFY